MMRLTLLFVITGTALSQSLSFDAASIKPAPPPDGHGMRVSSSGGPGTKDPGLFTCENCTVSSLVTDAWNIKFYQLLGLDPFGGERFNITARIPEGATKEQFRLMMQNLLAERFKLVVHHDKKEMPIYELVVAKNGPKLKPSAPVPPDDAAPFKGGSSDIKRDKDGFPILKGTGMTMAIMKDRASTNWTNFTMEQLATNLSYQVGKPVTDATGLKDKYDIAMFWVAGSGGPSAPAAPDANGFSPQTDTQILPDIFTAVQEQLGLKLEPKKGMVDVIVVDHAEKMPTEN